MVSYLERVTIDPQICGGRPSIRGLRYPVSFLLDLLASTMDMNEILDDYPDLESEDFKAALEFSSRVVNGSTYSMLVAA
jgi:uncharacterized protein (DUF433 family)